MQLKGIHHVTAITSSAEKIYEFFTYVLGMRLVKKTVNQDDINTYHLFFADDTGSAGSDMTFFDFKNIQQVKHGNNELHRTSFRVPNDLALAYWLKRFTKYNVKHTAVKKMFGHKIIYFEDFDEQLYALISDEHNTGIESGIPWQKGPVPNEFGITGLGPVFINVNDLVKMKSLLENVFLMRETNQEGNVHLFEMGDGGNGASLFIVNDDSKDYSTQGYGGIHHIAFRVETNKKLHAWIDRLNSFGAPNSGYVDRFYFESLYTRLYPNILFEIATDEPGFIDDEESYEILGEKLALPPRFRSSQAKIEKIVRPIDTVRSTQVIKKEYL
ncbi:MAG TPA: ring-cleaving dioxygenase [Acholeplasma sp.]|nr:ring-cleaving dioxygenase [Acholeplasma sp.]